MNLILMELMQAWWVSAWVMLSVCVCETTRMMMKQMMMLRALTCFAVAERAVPAQQNHRRR